MNCGEMADVATEMALGALTGRGRAEAVAHLEACGTCQEAVRLLLAMADRLPELLPACDPPPGFEDAVLARIGLAPPVPGGHGRAARAWPLAAARVLATAWRAGRQRGHVLASRRGRP